MPGDRLTADQRRRIADGLTAGLTYAEIARRLGRPTSTITREIARNGGPHAYRAARAQLATSWRARRRKHPSAAGLPAAVDGEPPSVRDFEARFVTLMTETGMAPMTARVFVALFISEGGSLTAGELMHHLQVSPATISHAIRWLEQRELVSREREARRVRYIVDIDAWYQAWTVSARSMVRWADTTRQGADIFGADTPTGDRLHLTSQFLEHLSQDMLRAAEHWRHTFTRQRT
ncbi:helix-turn-helix domain-containing protein [Kribbella solani]|uniref:GbsR/MarR family transcriptional regulator n=1 Tax=Kribbella solani TaxID=236067 RepID=UPI0029B5374F|nr:helix-turn-helix domain-containing protein [Kribbella solani]MDX2974394.1 helix-turn-helix domain-containing protein [Kribbella solani]MDX3005257.1 helix-turn-helix domain-containing protein [Kribbella solani]